MIARMRRLVAVLLGISLLIGAGASPALADKPIYYIHGVDLDPPGGYSCSAIWSRLRNAFEAWGRTGRPWYVGYYEKDYRCGADVHATGSHEKHYETTGHSNSGGHTIYTDIRHLGYHLAWKIWRHYSHKGRSIDVVAHSMGGLLIRYALARTQRGHKEFPPYLLVDDVVTMGTPHEGAPFADGCTSWNEYHHCGEMSPNSALIMWLEDHARNPQGKGGTQWTVMGSEEDEVVPPSSGVGMRARFKVIYRSVEGVSHSDYYRIVDDSYIASIRYKKRGEKWIRRDYAPRPGRYAYQATSMRGW